MSTSHQAKQLELWESTPNPLDVGMHRGKSKRTEHREDKGAFSKRKLNDSVVESKQLELFCIEGRNLVPSVTILNDNLNIAANSTQRLSAFVKLEVDSILRGKSCAPFYNELCNMIFNGLSLPTQTGCADSDLNWLGGCANKMSVNSWFLTIVNSAQSKNSYKICCPSSIFAVLGFTDLENIESKLNKAIDKLRFKIRCLVDDLQVKATNLIVNNYKLVFLPTYETSQMVLKATRKINKKSVRNMLSWAFGRFAEHLEQAAKRKGVLIVRTNESYTSKTCPHCGKIHHKLRGNKVFKCPSCGFDYPRDWVGAVNNMLAALQAIAFNVQGTRLSIVSTESVDVRVAEQSLSCEA